MRIPALAFVVVISFVLARAADTPAPPLRVMFIGNSLTYRNDLPQLVQAMAAAAGKSLEVIERTGPDLALEDHWRSGARGTLVRRKPQVVLMQQGPSTLPDSRAHLREWTRRWAAFARENGAEPVLYMVWPYATQRGGFLLASTSYREAARESGTRVFPAGEAWALALHAQPQLELYEPDALHPTTEGSFLAALVIARGLTGLDPDDVPAELKLASGQRAKIAPEHAALFRHIVRGLRYEDAPDATATLATPAAR